MLSEQIWDFFVSNNVTQSIAIIKQRLENFGYWFITSAKTAWSKFWRGMEKSTDAWIYLSAIFLDVLMLTGLHSPSCLKYVRKSFKQFSTNSIFFVVTFMSHKKYYRSSKIIRRSFCNQRLRISLYNLCVFFISFSLWQFSSTSAHIAAEILYF